MERITRIEIPADDEGYVSFQCPSCGERFKLRADEVEQAAPDPLYCPLCGLSAEQSSFYTQAVEDVALQHAENFAAEALHEMFKEMERKSRSKSITFKAGPPPRKKPVSELREVTDLAVVRLACCDMSIKVPNSDALSGVYCPYCGMEQV